MAKRLRVTGSLHSVQKSVQGAAEDTARLREKLTSEYFDNRSRMGRSDDLEMVDQRYESAMKCVDELENALDSYSEILKQIRKNYYEAQERAIVMAQQIPVNSIKDHL